MSPSPLGWLGLRAAREMRVSVEGGALTLTRPEGGAVQPAGPGQVTRVIHVPHPPDVGLYHSRRRPAMGVYLTDQGVPRGWPPDGVGAVVFLVGDRPVLTLWVFEWWPGTAGEADVTSALEMTGIAAIAEALGCQVDLAQPVDVAVMREYAEAVKASVVSPLPTLPRWLRALAIVAYASWVTVLVTAMLRIGRDPGVVLPAVVAMMAAATLTLLVVITMMRQRAARLIASTSVANGQIRPRSAPMRHVPGLQVTTEWVVARDGYGREAWMPGRSLGGITRADLADDGMALRDQAGRLWTAIPGPGWFDDMDSLNRARAALDAAGYRTRTTPRMDRASHATKFWRSEPPYDPPFPLIGIKEPTGLHTMSPRHLTGWSAGPALIPLVGWPDTAIIAVSAAAMLTTTAVVWLASLRGMVTR